MAGALLARQLSRSRARFTLASQNDDAEIRALLRNNPIRGAISVSLEREPNFFTDLPGETRTVVIARVGRALACVGSCAFRSRFVNGQPRRVGYLGSLRLDAPFAGRFDILRRGYEFFRDLTSANPADFYFTSIASDNARARQFLERGLRGLPTYEFLTEFITLVVSVRSSVQTSAAFSVEQFSARDLQFAPCDPLPNGPIWDQRAFKQTVVRGYSPAVAFIRPFYNLFAPVRLPAVGEALAGGFVISSPTVGLSDLMAQARAMGLEYLTFGFAANDPRLPGLRAAVKAREYRSRLYVVRWPGVGGSVSDLDTRAVAPEVALL